MTYNPNPFTSAPTTQELVVGSNPNLLAQNNQVEEVGKGNTGTLEGADNTIESSLNTISEVDRLKLSKWNMHLLMIYI